MNSLELKNDLLRKLYIEDPSALDGTILAGLEAEVVSAINRAFQMIWTAPKSSHFTRKHFTFSVVGGTSSYALDSTLQAVLGPVKLDGATPHLRAITERGDFDNYPTRFKGALSNAAASGRPEAYFLERLFADAAEATTVNMLLTPTPDTSYSADFEGSIEAPNFTLAEIDADVALPMPHQYVESILQPIARMYITRSHFFMADRRQAEIQAFTMDYAEARRQIGATDPLVPEDSTQPTA